MNNIAIVFPGQGAQSNLMGASFKENNIYQEVQKIAYQFEEELAAIINSSDDERINQTEYSQLAICANQLGIWQVIKETFQVSEFTTCGFSLGEYSALALAAEMELSTIFDIVNKRSKQMAKLNGNGTMKAIIGLNYDELSVLLDVLNTKYNTNIAIANYNLEKQIIVAGSVEDFVKIDSELTEKTRRVVELKVSGAFHTDIFNQVAEEFVQEIKAHLPINLVNEFYSNVTADSITKIDADYLVKHMVTGVNWYAEVNKMIADGIDTFVEIGEKSVLSPMIKKINRKVTTIHISNEEDLVKLEELWIRK